MDSRKKKRSNQNNRRTRDNKKAVTPTLDVATVSACEQEIEQEPVADDDVISYGNTNLFGKNAPAIFMLLAMSCFLFIGAIKYQRVHYGSVAKVEVITDTQNNANTSDTLILHDKQNNQ